ncbi:hypothetical protein BCN13_27805, partial [Salmonella enterica]|nr:hypothetical protein [Salmonella enterica]
MTTVDMGGTAIFDDGSATDKGWTHNYPHADNPNGGWIFNNTTVTAGGDVMLGGVGFTNSTVSVSSGNLSIDNNSAALLTGTTITVGDGAVNVHAGAGNIDLSKGNISAKGDITLLTDNGSITISGTSTTETASITSDSGNINITGNVAGLRQNGDGVLFRDTSLQAKVGEIKVKGIADGFNSSRFTGGVRLGGQVTFNSTLNTIDGTHVHGGLADRFGGVVFNGGDFNFINDTVINAIADSYAGLLFDVGYSTANLNFQNGRASIVAENDDKSKSFVNMGGVFIVPYFGRKQSINFNMNKADLNISAVAYAADTAFGAMVSFYTVAGSEANPVRESGYVFSGNGNVNINATSDLGYGIELRELNNLDLEGEFTVSGQSNNRAGVIVSEHANVNVTNATITGSSHSGTGILINAADKNTHQVNLNGNTLIGTSDTSTGININGNNVTITNGTLNGTATTGNGAGVTITGGTNYTLDGAKVTGQSADGAGVSVGGTLTVNNGTVVNGTSSGSGAGVSVAGTLTTTSGDGVTLKGKSDSGDGVQVAGDTSLMNATVDGTSASGIGTNINGCLTVSGTSGIKGTSTSGAGLNIDKSVTVAETDRSTVTFTGTSTEKEGVILGSQINGGTVTGISTSGDGVVLAENAVVKQTTLKGSSTTGNGVNITGGNVKLDDATAKTLVAGSGSGSGLILSEGADIQVVQSSDMTMPVTAAEVLKGTSETGSGVTVAGNAAVSGVILKGDTTAENGTGVTLKNSKLTLSDNLSGVEAGATGNGTALVLENATMDAKGYRESEGEDDAKDYTLSAAVTGDGTAVKTAGDIVLISVKMNATSGGNGSALTIMDGTLASDREITASSSGEQGAAVVLNGGSLQGAGEMPVMVKASASGDKGMAVKVEKTELSEGEGSSSSLKNINLQASSDKGTVLDVAG